MRKNKEENKDAIKTSRRRARYVKRIGKTLTLIGAGMIGFGIAQVLRKDAA